MATEAERKAAQLRGRTGGESRPGYFGGLGTAVSNVPGALATGARGAQQGYGAARGGIATAIDTAIDYAGRPFSATDAARFGPLVPNLEGGPMAAGSTLSMPGTPSRGRVDDAIRQIAADRAAAEQGATRRSRGTVNPWETATDTSGPERGTRGGWLPPDVSHLGRLREPTGVPVPGALDNLQALVEGAVARATQPQGGLGALEGETAATQRSRTPIRRFGSDLSDLESLPYGAPAVIPPGGDDAAAAAAAEAERLRLAAAEAERLRLLGLNPGGGPPGPAPGPAPVSDTIRSLYGEMSTRDFSDMLRSMMTERETNLKDLNKQSVEQLAASVLRRTGQIGDIKTALETELGILDADRAGVQQGLVDAVALRAQEMQSGTEASLTAAREGLGDQVTDEFEKIAQIVGSQAGSQAASSQDAMARLAQIGDMSARERLAAPAQLAAESELALGDEEFAYTQQLQSNLSEALAGLDAEESERIIGEAMRQENFNIGRDQRMIESLVGDLIRKDTQAWQSGEAQLGRDFQAGESQLGRDFSADQGLLGREFSAEQALLSRTFSGKQSALSQAFQTTEREAAQTYKSEQAEIVRAANEDAARLKQEAATMAAEAEAAGDAVAAKYYKIDVALWRQMSATERAALREQRLEQEQLAGIGAMAFPIGTMQNFQQRYPKLDPDLFIHVNAMMGIDTLNAEEDAAKKRDQYLEGLRTTDAFGAKGLSVAETSMIDTLYAEYARDVADVDLQSRNIANDARNVAQRERAREFTR